MIAHLRAKRRARREAKQRYDAMLQFLPFLGGADLDNELEIFRSVDVDDEVAMRSTLRAALVEKVGYAESRGLPNPEMRSALIELDRFASGDRVEAEAEFNSNLFPFEAPKGDARLFFRWVHDELSMLAPQNDR
jgi:hypothetical protein